MDAQELRNLQEAYMEVYDEGYKLFPYRKVKTKQKQIATDYDSLGKKPLLVKVRVKLVIHSIIWRDSEIEKPH